MRNPILDDALAVLASAGINDVLVLEGKHINLKFVAPNGVRRTIVIPRTASDHRAGRNLIAELKRQLRAPDQTVSAVAATSRQERRT